MKTRKHLNIFDTLVSILFALCIIGTIICLIAIITGESGIPFLCCAILTLSLYFGKVLLNTIIEIYDAVVTKHKTLDKPNTDTTNSQEQ